MAYSDYGGYAFRNGQRIEERSDWTLTPEGGEGTPGAYPGFAKIALGATPDEAKAFADLPHFHTAIGDWPLIVGMYKQSGFHLYMGTKKLDPLDYIDEIMKDKATSEYEGKKSFSAWNLKDSVDPIIFSVEGAKIEAYFTDTSEDNHYMYVRLEQPDGVVWHGWSGYGVGAGLEECGYGYSTEQRNRRLHMYWPDDFKQAA